MWPKRNTMMVHFLYHDGTESVPSWFLVSAVVAGFGGFEVFFFEEVFFDDFPQFL